MFDEICPSGLAPIRFGDKWAPLVIACLEHGPRRFSELRVPLRRVTPKGLTKSLRGLERDGLVSRTSHPGTPPHQPPRHTAARRVRTHAPWPQPAGAHEGRVRLGRRALGGTARRARGLRQSAARGTLTVRCGPAGGRRLDSGAGPPRVLRRVGRPVVGQVGGDFWGQGCRGCCGEWACRRSGRWVAAFSGGGPPRVWGEWDGQRWDRWAAISWGRAALALRWMGRSEVGHVGGGQGAAGTAASGPVGGG